MTHDDRAAWIASFQNRVDAHMAKAARQQAMHEARSVALQRALERYVRAALIEAWQQLRRDILRTDPPCQLIPTTTHTTVLPPRADPPSQ